jgi:hypothetical protein
VRLCGGHHGVVRGSCTSHVEVAVGWGVGEQEQGHLVTALKVDVSKLTQGVAVPVTQVVAWVIDCFLQRDCFAARPEVTNKHCPAPVLEREVANDIPQDGPQDVLVPIIEAGFDGSVGD